MQRNAKALFSKVERLIGAVVGKIFNSYLLGNKIIISGVFSASVSGVQVCNNLAVIDIPTGQLSAPPTSFLSSSKIYDLEFANNKFYLAGNFSSVNVSTIRYNMAILDNNLNYKNVFLGKDGQFSEYKLLIGQFY